MPIRSSTVSLLTVLTVGLVSACPGDQTVSGTYETRDSTGFMILDFKSGGKVHMTTEERGQRDSADGEFVVAGNKVTVQVPGGMPLVLTRNGDRFEATISGQTMVFAKK